jgi:hypothetical protein
VTWYFGFLGLLVAVIAALCWGSARGDGGKKTNDRKRVKNGRRSGRVEADCGANQIAFVGELEP